MIDIETLVFGELNTALRAKFDTIFVAGEYIPMPAKEAFPFVSVIERDNSMYERTQDSGDLENHVSVMYEINVYSNKKTGKKSETKAIFAEIDRVMKELGFTRMMLNPVANVEDATIYRMVGRYRAIVSKDNTIFRR